MLSVFKDVPQGGTAQTLLLFLSATALGILLLLTFVLVRRALRKRYFRTRDRRLQYFREHWIEVLNGKIPVKQWFSSKMDRAIVENLLLEEMDSAEGCKLEALRAFARKSGLMEFRVHQICNRKWPTQKSSLIMLGRMRLPESIPTLWKALQDASRSMVPVAVKALGMVGMPEAAEPILRHMQQRSLQCTPIILQTALVQCYRSNPQLLLEKTLKADDSLRPILARALAEIADNRICGNLMQLVLDPLAEVRACAARILAAVRPPYALNALSKLLRDKEWFVRLRAAVALGELGEKQGVALLINALCDPNRLVRLRAAGALILFRGEEERIIQSVIATGDRYALQALVSELQRSGRLTELVDQLGSGDERATETVLLTSLRNGSMHMIVDSLLYHPNRKVRARLAQIIAVSGHEPLRDYLMELEMTENDHRRRRLLRWAISRLEKTLKSKITTEEAIPA